MPISPPLHPNESALTPATIRRLLTRDLPTLSHLPLRSLGNSGTDFRLYRLGPAHLLRFPRLAPAADQLRLLADWLPRLADALPIPLPRPLHLGQPGEGFPFPWMPTSWLPGQPGGPTLSDPRPARDLAALLQALHRLPVPPGAPLRLGPSPIKGLSGLAPLIAQVTESDPSRLSALLDRLQSLPDSADPPVLTHGDLHPLNWLLSRHHLSGVIDWGTFGLADRAVDLLPAFLGLDGAARDAFLTTLAPSPAELDRARALALRKIILGLPYYRATNPAFAAVLRAGLPRLWAD